MGGFRHEAGEEVALDRGEIVFDGPPRALFADEGLLARTGQERPALARVLAAARERGAAVPADLRWRDLAALDPAPVVAPGSVR